MINESRQQSPLFVKTYQFLLWMLPITLKFPKAQRFLLAERLGKMTLDFYDLIVEAVSEPSHQMQKINQADQMLTKIRLYVRLSFDMQCMSIGQYKYAAGLLDELGRLLGGWKRKRTIEGYNSDAALPEM